MKRLVKNIIRRLALSTVALVALSSCSMMTEDELDCSPHYEVRFRFDMNMLYADAFPSQVGEVDLYVFDTDGNIVWIGHEEGTVLTQEGYTMNLPLAPGKYNLVAWCRKRRPDASDFSIDGGRGPSTPIDVRMKMSRAYDNDSQTANSSTDLHALFHGSVRNVELPDKWGTHTVTVPLTKDTNSIRIMLVHLSGKKINSEDFSFKITDNNGYLDHDNTILADEKIEYRPWAQREGVASTVLPGNGNNTRGIFNLNEDTRAPITEVHSLVAEMTTSRLQTCQTPVLTVTRNSDNEKIIEIPLIDYFMMVKGEYHRPMDDDEYLDRQDDYNMTFFLLEDGSWYKAVVDILSWRVVLQNTDL